VVIDRFSPYFLRRDAYGFKNVRPGGWTRIYYGGLSEEEIFNICYHFDSDLPQGNEVPYEADLWRAISDWQSRHKSGAYFYQFQGDQLTLLIDTRDGRRKAFLLGGSADRLHRFLRKGHTHGKIAGELVTANTWMDLLTFSIRDIVLHRVAAALDAILIDGPPGPDGLDDFLAAMVDKGILLEMDNRYLALATDCGRRDIAATFGLEDFVETREAGRTPIQELSYA
jgi:hypothetical protein